MKHTLLHVEKRAHQDLKSQKLCTSGYTTLYQLANMLIEHYIGGFDMCFIAQNIRLAEGFRRIRLLRLTNKKLCKYIDLILNGSDEYSTKTEVARNIPSSNSYNTVSYYVTACETLNSYRYTYECGFRKNFNKIRTRYTHLDTMLLNTNNKYTESTVYKAFNDENISVINQLFIDHGRDVFNEQHLNFAIRVNKFSVVKWLHEHCKHDKMWCASNMISAIYGEHLHMVMWLYIHRTEANKIMAITTAAETNSIIIYAWLYWYGSVDYTPFLGHINFRHQTHFDNLRYRYSLGIKFKHFTWMLEVQKDIGTRRSKNIHFGSTKESIVAYRVNIDGERECLVKWVYFDEPTWELESRWVDGHDTIDSGYLVEWDYAFR